MSKPYQIVLDTSVPIAAVRSRRGASFELPRRVGDERWQLHRLRISNFGVRIAKRQSAIAESMRQETGDSVALAAGYGIFMMSIGYW